MSGEIKVARMNAKEDLSERQKRCRICGDSATGFNFNVVTCESCKSFFRRNAHRDVNKISCPFDDSCEVNVSTRRSCRKCRLRKCLQLGMRHESEHLPKRNTSQVHTADTTNCELNNAQLSPSDSSWPHPSLNVRSMQTECTCHCRCVRATAVYALSADDVTMLSELKEASSALRVSETELHELLAGGFLGTSPENITANRIVMMMERGYRRLIEMCKQLSVFSKLCQDDQIALIKGGIAEMHVLRQAHAYDPETRTFRFMRFNPEYKFGIDVETLHARFPSIDIILGFVRTFDPDWANDSNMILILLAITLYNPTRPKLMHTEIIMMQHRRYNELLLRYIQNQHGVNARAQYIYEAVQAKLLELRSYACAPQRVLELADPETIGPLVAELYDLKPPLSTITSSPSTVNTTT